jgi:heat shock protein HtpX
MFLNQFKTVLLLVALGLVLLLIGWFIGGFAGLTIGLAIALSINLVSYFYSDKIVLRMYRAKKLEEEDAPGLHAVVEEIAKEADIPKPKVYLIPSDNANAFATGRNPKNAVVGVTAGILKLLSHEELKGVIAHEISHIKNRDILIQTVAATIATVIAYARFAAIFLGGGDRDGRGMEMLLLFILAPIIAIVLQLAISRSREYLADERGAKLIGNGEPLASALLKLEENAKYHPLRFGNRTTSSLFITNPFRGRDVFALFSTHPPITKRVDKLRSIKI